MIGFVMTERSSSKKLFQRIIKFGSGPGLFISAIAVAITLWSMHAKGTRDDGYRQERQEINAILAGTEFDIDWSDNTASLHAGVEATCGAAAQVWFRLTEDGDEVVAIHPDKSNRQVTIATEGEGLSERGMKTLDDWICDE